MHTKRIASGYGKKPRWVVTPRGPYCKGECIPLMLVVRDLLGYADNAREATRIIKDGLILVDRKPRKDPKYSVGLMDIVEIPKTGECFRILPAKNRYGLKPIDKKEATVKPCKIIGKTLVRKGRIQLNLHDGSNILIDEDSYGVGDTVVLELPERKINAFIKFNKGCLGIIVRGRHRGESGRIGGISPGNAIQKSITEIGDFQTLSDYIFVIGEDKPVVAV